MSSLEEMRTAMDVLVRRLAPGLPGSDLGEVFDHLIWLTDDNGVDLTTVCLEWLRGDDLRRVQAALAVSEVFLFRTRLELADNLLPLADRWPEVAERVREILAAWDDQHG
jgi:hypothetical protein